MPTKKTKKEAPPTAIEDDDIDELWDEDEDDYVDQESEWEDMRFVAEESESHRMFSDFTGGEKGISGKTDLTPSHAVLLTHMRVMQEQYKEFDLDLDLFPEWFETYRLSVERGSRRETVELFGGRVGLAPGGGVLQPGQPTQQDPARFS